MKSSFVHTHIFEIRFIEIGSRTGRQIVSNYLLLLFSRHKTIVILRLFGDMGNRRIRNNIRGDITQFGIRNIIDSRTNTIFNDIYINGQTIFFFFRREYSDFYKSHVYKKWHQMRPAAARGRRWGPCKWTVGIFDGGGHTISNIFRLLTLSTVYRIPYTVVSCLYVMRITRMVWNDGAFVLTFCPGRNVFELATPFAATRLFHYCFISNTTTRENRKIPYDCYNGHRFSLKFSKYSKRGRNPSKHAKRNRILPVRFQSQ